MAAVVRAEPDWNLLPRDLSPTLLVYLRRCLQKDPKQRVGDIRDVRLALEGAFDAEATPTAAPGRTPARGRRLGWTIAAAAVLISTLLAVPAVRHLREPRPPEMRLEIITPATTDPVSFALSPDGRQIVFVASGDGPSRLWLRPLASTTAQPLAGTEGASLPFWSPDSRSVGFFADGKLKRLDIGGGPPQMRSPTRSLAAGRGTRTASSCFRGRGKRAVPRPGLGRRGPVGDNAGGTVEPSVSPVPARRPAIPVLRRGIAGKGGDLPGLARLADVKRADGGGHGRRLHASGLAVLAARRTRSSPSVWTWGRAP